MPTFNVCLDICATVIRHIVLTTIFCDIFLTGRCSAEPIDFSIADTVTPSYSSQHGAYLQNELIASGDMSVGNFDYTIVFGTTNQRGGKEQDLISGAFGAFVQVDTFRIGLTQSAFVRFQPNFSNYNRTSLPTRIYLQRPSAVGQFSILFPEISIARRNSIDRPDLERIEVRPSISFLTAFAQGVLEFDAQFAFQKYDLNNRFDESIYLQTMWTKDISQHASIGLDLSYKYNWSNIKGDYGRWEIGPSFSLSFGTD